MYAYFNLSVEYSFVAFDGHLVDVDIELVGNHLRNVVQHALAVDASYLDCSVEEHHLMHIPLGIENTFAIGSLQFVCHGAVAAVYFDAVLVVDISQYVVTRNSVATGGEYELRDILLVDDDGFLLVEALADKEEVVLLAFLLLAMAEEGHVLEPAAGSLVLLLIFKQFLNVLVAEQYCASTDGKKQVFVLLHVVDFAQLVEHGRGHLELVLLQPVVENLLALLLGFAVVASQYCHNLLLGFSR